MSSRRCTSLRNELHNNVVGDRRHYRAHFIGLVSMVLLSVNISGDQAAAYDQAAADPNQRIEVFTSTERPIVQMQARSVGRKIVRLDVRAYVIDGMQLLEDTLSFDMPTDPRRSKQVALQRLQEIDEEAKLKLQLAAIGLTKAMHYGIDRYPAVVFNGEAVVYGVTDIAVALEYYQAWQNSRRP